MKKYVSKKQLKKRIIFVLTKLGFNVDEIYACICSWEYASLSEKHSHGFNRIIWLKEMVQQNKIVPNTSLEISSQGIITHIEGKKSLGYLAAEKAVHSTITAAKLFGIGMTTVSDCYPTGCMGQYTEKITESNQIGIAISHSPPRVAAFGTVDKIFGTMGHSFGFPSKKIPYIYDASIGALTNGAIMDHHSTNTLFPHNSVFTKNGVMTVNPSDVIDDRGIFNGIIAIAGDRYAHKMSGLAGSLELLTSLALIKGNINTDTYSFFMAINPSFFGHRAEYKNIVTLLEDKIIKARKIKDIHHVYYAGQKSYLLRKKNSTKKTVQIANITYKFLFPKK